MPFLRVGFRMGVSWKSVGCVDGLFTEVWRFELGNTCGYLFI